MQIYRGLTAQKYFVSMNLFFNNHKIDKVRPAQTVYDKLLLNQVSDFKSQIEIREQ